MGERIYLNRGWEFTCTYSDAFLSWEDTDTTLVCLPHTCRETPYDYFDESAYQMLCGYRKKLYVPVEWSGKTLLLTFGAAAHAAQVFLNGTPVAEHACGYTAFTVDLTGRVRTGADNEIVVRLDTRETLDQPPFGYVIDYMTYGGLYREVWLDVKERAHITDVFAKPEADPEKSAGILRSEITLDGLEPESEFSIRQTVSPAWDPELITARGNAHVTKPLLKTKLSCGQVKLWDVEGSNLYIVKTELLRDGTVIDCHTVRVGFRTAEFKADGFYLNGRRLLLRGLNRHQSYPYVGYAMPASMQRMDAEILKNELGLNAVRTSHYPQSHHFIDRCDELGLLVFTEIPGWQHIGGEEWKAQAVENVREMVAQYRNHPSIVLWGVRINESNDDDTLYMETNRVARELDPTRQTGGVRCIKKSNLLEDVYTYNDFSHNGLTPGCDPKKAVTPDLSKGYLISEYNGHMYPTKMFDSEYHILEHALRHARVLDAVAGEKDIAGCFGWCMFDYNTHRDFGSGDRICYHGVMDMYRNPKLAAAVYAAQQWETPVLEVSSQMDIGEHPTGNMGKVYIISNADSVRMYKNDRLLKEYFSENAELKNLLSAPILVDDYIGDQLETEENYPKAQAELVRDILNYSAIYGFENLPVKIKAKAARAMAVYHMSFQDAYRLYGKYIGAWGSGVTEYRFEAIRDGQVVKTVVRSPAVSLHLSAEESASSLREGSTYDVAAVRVRMNDQNENLARFYQGPVRLRTEGPIQLIGPEILTLRGGCGGTYVKTTGTAGPAALYLESDQGGEVCIRFEIEKEE